MKLNDFFNIKIIILVIIIIIQSLYSISSYFTSKNDIEISRTNLYALRDTVHDIKINDSTLIKEKQVLLIEEKELKLINDSLYKVNNLYKKKLKTTIYQLSDIKSKIIIDTVYIPYNYKDTINNNINIDYNSKWFNIKGTLNKDNLVLNNINIPVPITISYTSDNKFQITSPNPYINITNIDSYTIRDNIPSNIIKKSKFYINHGLYVGMGLQYSLITKNIDIGPQIGYGIIIHF